MNLADTSRDIQDKMNVILGNKLNDVTLNVTNSFLSGRVTSPLLACAHNVSGQAAGITMNILATAGRSGLYINEDGVQFDPSVITDRIGLIVNSAVQMTFTEMKRIEEKAVAELTYIPDPSLIMKYAVDRFIYNVKNSVDFNELFNGLKDTSINDKVEKENEETQENTKNSITEKIAETTATVTTHINKVSDKINKGVGQASYYMAFGPEYVSRNVSKFISTGSKEVDTWVTKQTDAVNNWKLDQYKKIGDAIGDKMTKKYESLIRDNVQEINDQPKIQETKLKLKATSLVQKANLAIMSKTGLNIPIDKVNGENLSKIKRAKEIANLMSLLASAGTSSDGPETSNETLQKNVSQDTINEHIQTRSKDLKNLEQIISRENNLIMNAINTLNNKSYNELLDADADDLMTKGDATINANKKTVNVANQYYIILDDYLSVGDSALTSNNRSYNELAELLGDVEKFIGSIFYESNGMRWEWDITKKQFVGKPYDTMLKQLNDMIEQYDNVANL